MDSIADVRSQNYCIVAFGIVLIISTIQWFVDGRKNYSGPKIEVVPQEVLTSAQSHPQCGYREGLGDHKLSGYDDPEDVKQAAGRQML